MVAADPFNQTGSRTGLSVFGCVTTGETWLFAKLAGSEVLLESHRYYDEVDLILGAFQVIINECRGCA